MTSILPNFVQEKTDEQKKQAEVKRSRLTKLASIFARTNSVLTGKRINVYVTDNSSIQAPAYSSTTEVWFNSAVISDDFTAKGLISLQGLDFHELSHLRFTPRNAHALPTWVKENNYWQAFNALEDMRIENLMVAQLPSVANWLTTTICDYLLNDEKAIKFSYSLTYGRKYLPTELQQLAIDKFERPDLISEFETLIDEYNDFVFENNDEVERAKVVIARYSELLDELIPKQPNEPNGHDGYPDPFGHSTRPTDGYESSSNRPATPTEQKKLRDKSAKDNADKKKVERQAPATNSDKSKENADSNSDNNSDNSSDSKIQARQEKVAERNAETDFDDLEFDEFDYDDDDVSYGSDYEQAGNKQVGNQNGATGDNKQVTETTNAINEVINNAVNDLAKEINSIAKQLGISIDLVGGNAETPQTAQFNEVNANPDLVLIAKAFTTELERLKAKHEPAWEYETELGNLNVYRYLNNEDFDICFDEWQEGRSDVTDIEAVILLDKSGSMSGVNADEAYKSMWAIKSALDKVNARTSVVLFDMRSYLLYSADERATHFIKDGGASGGTNPEHSLLFAKRVLAESQKKIKLLFMITDGAWETDNGEKAVKEMRNAGVLTCQAYLEQCDVRPESLERYRHGFELLTHIKSAKDILTLGKELVRIGIARNLISR